MHIRDPSSGKSTFYQYKPPDFKGVLKTDLPTEKLPFGVILHDAMIWEENICQVFDNLNVYTSFESYKGLERILTTVVIWS